MNYAIAVAPYYLLAFVVPLLLPVLAIVQYRLADLVPEDLRATLVLVMIAFGSLLTVALAPRQLNMDELAPGALAYASDFANGFMTSRVLNVVLVGIALVEIGRALLRAKREHAMDASFPLAFGLLAFYVGVPLMQLVGSDFPGFKPQGLYAPIVLTGICLLRIERTDRIMAGAKAGILACTLGSLLSAIVAPDFALLRPSPGLIPGINFRLYGMTTNPNVLGPIALVGLLLELHTPWRRRSLHWLQLGSTVAALILAQSKTAWVAALIIGLVTWLPLNMLPAMEPQLRHRTFGRAAITLIGCMLVLAFGVIALSQFDLQSYLNKNASLLTLTGRFEIWTITLNEWHKNLFFGYGPGLWSPEYMARQNLMHVGQAHNQFVQTLGEAGLLGLLMLLAYIGLLLNASIRCFRASRGIVLALFTLMLIRCVTEASLRSEGLLNWTFFTHALLVALACHHLRQASSAKAIRASSPRHRFGMQAAP